LTLVIFNKYVDTNNDIPRTIVDINENSDRILNTIANDNKIIIVL